MERLDIQKGYGLFVTEYNEIKEWVNKVKAASTEKTGWRNPWHSSTCCSAHAVQPMLIRIRGPSLSHASTVPRIH